MRTFIRISLVALFIVVIFFAGRKSVTWVTSFKTGQTKYTYADNRNWRVFSRLSPMYNRHYDIVMFGDSHIANVQWHELTGGCDIANRGIGGDISAGCLSRIKGLIALKPKICFVQVGINDISYGTPMDETQRNLRIIVDTLKSQGIRAVMMHVFHVSEQYPESVKVNAAIKQLNTYIDGLGVEVLNLNPTIAPEGKLLPQYDLYDGIHLSPAAYKVWVDSMERYIK